MAACAFSLITYHNTFSAVPVAQPDRASDFGSEGWGFESLQARISLAPRLPVAHCIDALTCGERKIGSAVALAGESNY